MALCLPLDVKLYEGKECVTLSFSARHLELCMECRKQSNLLLELKKKLNESIKEIDNVKKYLKFPRKADLQTHFPTNNLS